MEGLKEEKKKLKRYPRRSGVAVSGLVKSSRVYPSSIIAVTGKVTSKCQVTIPSEARKALNINAGDQIVFEVQDNSTMTVRKLTAIDTLANQIGSQLRQEFPTPEDLNSYLDKNRKELFEKIYGNLNDKGSD